MRSSAFSRRDARVVDDDFAMRIDAADRFLRGFGLGAAHVRVRVEDLALQIGKIHGVEIHDADFADAGGGEIHGDGRAETARADAQHAGGFDASFGRPSRLPAESDAANTGGFRHCSIP